MSHGYAIMSNTKLFKQIKIQHFRNIEDHHKTLIFFCHFLQHIVNEISLFALHIFKKMVLSICYIQLMSRKKYIIHTLFILIVLSYLKLHFHV